MYHNGKIHNWITNNFQLKFVLHYIYKIQFRSYRHSQFATAREMKLYWRNLIYKIRVSWIGIIFLYKAVLHSSTVPRLYVEQEQYSDIDFNSIDGSLSFLQLPSICDRYNLWIWFVVEEKLMGILNVNAIFNLQIIYLCLCPKRIIFQGNCECECLDTVTRWTRWDSKRSIRVVHLGGLDLLQRLGTICYIDIYSI